MSLINENNGEISKLDFYRDKMNNGKLIELKFESVDVDGNLYIYDDEVRVQLDSYDIDLTYKKAKFRAAALDVPYLVIVKSIDYIRKIVHVSFGKSKEMIRKELLAELNYAIEKNEPYTIFAQVIRIKGEAGSNYTIIDLGNVGVIGVIKMKDWSITYTDNLRLETWPGDIISVKIIKQIRWNGKPAYSCSRRETINVDPWNGLEARLSKNTAVRVMCTSKTMKNFFAKLKGLVELMPTANIREI